MNIKERKDLQQELLGIVFNILVESEDSAIEAMETRAVEIIKKLKEHINDDIEHGVGFDSQKIPILDWIIACDSQDHVRLNNKSLLKFEKAIKDIGGRSQRNSRGYVEGEREGSRNDLANDAIRHVTQAPNDAELPYYYVQRIVSLGDRDENITRQRDQEMLDHILSQRTVRLSNRGENMIRQRAREMLDNLRTLNRAHDREILLSLSGNRSENIRRPIEQIQPSEIPLNLFGNRDENVIIRERRRAGRQMRPNFVRREREVPLSSKIGQLIGVVSSIIVGAFIGIMVGMVIAGLCIELCVITTSRIDSSHHGCYCCYRSYCSRNCSCIKANRDV